MNMLGKTNSGVYQIFVNVRQNRNIIIGKLGSCLFNKGKYIYTGRAKKNLDQRIARHYKLDKKYFWHIDYFLSDEYVDIIDIFIKSGNFYDECVENKKLIDNNATIVIDKFGASDCINDCGSHLLRIN
jgi:Uri superfamily endonuclease|tara:strand:- start:1331 stop:1714 length:384 start_codon:yes stop_codon:yes gene_type:complete